MDVFKCTLLSNEKLTETSHDMRVSAPGLADAKPGEFVHVKCEGFTLRRPISICDNADGVLRLIVDVRGKGTDWLTSQPVGATLDILGPLGHGFTSVGRVLVVGGGIGTPPLLYAAKCAASADAILGFRTASAVMLTADFEAVCGRVDVATDDGTLGFHGRVDALLEQRLATEKYDRVLACGPTPMLRSCKRVCEAAGVPLEISLEERMGCGVGACLVCAVKLKDENGGEYMGHVCKNGPVFRSEEVCFDD